MTDLIIISHHTAFHKAGQRFSHKIRQEHSCHMIFLFSSACRFGIIKSLSRGTAKAASGRIMQMDTIERMSRKRCLFALISAAVAALGVCIGVTMNLTTLYDVNFDHMGLRTFCMFTVNSNILCGVGMMLTLPYAIDGLRKKNFHLPNWMVDFLFAGVTSVGLTFLISLFVLSPVKGFVLIFTGSRFFLHGLSPILAIIAFCFFITSHDISLRESVFALLPVLLYAMVYYFMVEILGPDNGGWDDFYGFLTRIPSWISLVSFMPLTFGIAAILRFLHNRTVLRLRQREASLYREAMQGKSVREQIIAIAETRTAGKKPGNCVIPLWLLEALSKESGELGMEEACRLYLDSYLKKANDTWLRT